MDGTPEPPGRGLRAEIDASGRQTHEEEGHSARGNEVEDLSNLLGVKPDEPLAEEIEQQMAFYAMGGYIFAGGLGSSVYANSTWTSRFGVFSSTFRP